MERSNDVNKSAINEKAKEYKNTINIVKGIRKTNKTNYKHNMLSISARLYPKET